MPDAIGWAEDGLVDPETILEQEKKMLSNEMRGTLLCLAAHAYFHRGDKFNTLRCLKEAAALSDMTEYSVKDTNCKSTAFALRKMNLVLES